MDSTTQTGHASTDDWQEEIYQKVKSMKELYFTEITELHQKISLKIQQFPQNEALGPPAKQSEQFDKLNLFKQMLECTIMLLQISKSNIQANLREKLPIYEKQIMSFVASNRSKKVVPPQQQGQPQSKHNSGQSHSMSQQTSMDLTTQTGYASTVDWQEELYQKVKSMKELYFTEITELHQKISLKIQQFPQNEALGPPAKQSEQFDKLNQFKQMLERTIMLLQISKSNIQANLREKLPIYEKQMMSFVASNRSKKVVPPQQQGQSHSKHNSGQSHSMSQQISKMMQVMQEEQLFKQMQIEAQQKQHVLHQSPIQHQLRQQNHQPSFKRKAKECNGLQDSCSSPPESSNGS